MNLSEINFPQELENLRTLCLTPSTDVSTLETLIQTLNHAGYHDDVLTILRTCSECPSAQVDIAALWVRNKTARHQWGLSNDLRQFLTRGEIGRRATIAYVEALGNTARASSLVALLRTHAKWLRQDAAGWNAVAIALARAKKKWRLLRWTSDWNLQPQASQDALYRRAAVLWQLGLLAAANRVARTALTRPKVSEKVFSRLQVLVATQDALAGNSAAAAQALRQVDGFSLDEPTTRLHRLARSVVAVQLTPKTERWEALQNGLKQISKAFQKKPVWRLDWATQRCLQKAFWRMASDARSLRPLVWGYWRYYARVILSAFGILVGIILLPFLGIAILAMPCCLLIPIGVIAYLAVNKNRG